MFSINCQVGAGGMSMMYSHLQRLLHKLTVQDYLNTKSSWQSKELTE